MGDFFITDMTIRRIESVIVAFISFYGIIIKHNKNLILLSTVPIILQIF